MLLKRVQKRQACAISGTIRLVIAAFATLPLNMAFHVKLSSNPIDRPCRAPGVLRYRYRLASQSASWLSAQYLYSHDHGDHGNTMLNIGTVCNIFDESYTLDGLTGLLHLLDMAEFRLAVASALDTQHWKFNDSIDALLLKQFDAPASFLGSEKWPRHWAGAFVADKARNGTRIAGIDARALIKYFQHVQLTARTRDRGFPAVSMMHGVMYQYMAELSRLHKYPTELVNAWCGVYALENASRNQWWSDVLRTDLGRECRHGIGHGVYFNQLLAAYPLNMTACQTVRPHGLPRGVASLVLNMSLNICHSAPTTLLALDCAGGATHSLQLAKIGDGYLL